MNEPIMNEPVINEPVINEPIENRISIGQVITQRREQMGLSMTDVRRRLNLSEPTLQAIENDDYSALPGASLTRGYLRMYCRMLELPTIDILAQYDKLAKTDPELVPPPQSQRNLKPKNKGVGLVSVLVIAGMATLSGYYYLQTHEPDISPDVDYKAEIAAEKQLITNWPNNQESPPRGALDQPSSQATSSILDDMVGYTDTVESAPVETNLQNTIIVPSFVVDSIDQSNIAKFEPTTLEDIDRILNIPPVQQQSVSASVSDDITTAQNTAITPTVSVSTGEVASGETDGTRLEVASDVPEEESTEADQIATVQDPVISDTTPSPDIAQTEITTATYSLAISSPENCWVEINDGFDQRLMYGMLNAGQSRQLTGSPPFKVFLGNANPVIMSLNDQAIDVLPSDNPRNTSRFVLHADGTVSR